jgi:hypothetical protein
MALKDFLPKETETMQTSIEVNEELYSKVKAKLKSDSLTFHDLVHAAMLEYLAGEKKRKT